MDQKEIEQSFTSAGWALDDSFADDLIIGYDGDYLSILAHREVWESNNPAFEIIDHQQNITYWVQEILTPQQATEILQEESFLRCRNIWLV
jgi:hypothetical protein